MFGYRAYIEYKIILDRSIVAQIVAAQTRKFFQCISEGIAKDARSLFSAKCEQHNPYLPECVEIQKVIPAPNLKAYRSEQKKSQSLAINLKKLQAIARRKLGLKGAVEWDLVSKSQLKNQGLGREYLSTRSSATAHVISYSDASSLEAADVFHEMCKAKLKEMGFTTIEAAALNAMRDCCKDDPKYIRDANSAAAIVIETYANTILFSIFPEESRTQRERMVLRFESSDALTTLHTQMGFWGTAGVCYYLAASNNSQISFPQDLVEKAMGRASDGKEIRVEYDAINSLLEKLPKIDLGVERLTEEDGMRIVDVMVRLFSEKTGLEC